MSYKLKEDQRGIAQVIMVLIVIIVIAAIAGVGYKVANNKKSTTTTNSSAVTPKSTVTSAAEKSCLTTYHDSKLCSFASNSTAFDKASYTASLQSTQDGKTSSMTLKSDGKGNTEIATTTDGQQLNAITLDGNSYVQTGGTGPWLEYPASANDPASNPADSMKIGLDSKGITYKYLGTAKCGSYNCYKYQVSDVASPSTTQIVLFDTSAYLMREWQQTDTSGNSTTMDISYNSVNITKPSPVQSYNTAQ